MIDINKGWKAIKRAFTIENFAFILIALGVAVLIGTLFSYYWGGYIHRSENIDPSTSGQFGDFIGGVVGALWALAGVILFYSALRLQRKDLNDQREELQKTRREYELSRMTDVFFKQLDITLPILNDFSIKEQAGIQSRTHEYRGKASFRKLNGLLDDTNYQLENDIDHVWGGLELNKEEQYFQFIALLNFNNDKFVDLSTRLYSIKKALSSFASSVNIDEKDFEYLKMLFWNNLGSPVNEVLMKMKPTYDNYKRAKYFSSKISSLSEKDQYICVNRIDQFVSFFKVAIDEEE